MLNVEAFKAGIGVEKGMLKLVSLQSLIALAGALAFATFYDIRAYFLARLTVANNSISPSTPCSPCLSSSHSMTPTR